jgi:hypothetical protein
MIASQPTERLVGFAQILLSFLFLGCFFVVLGLFLLGYVKTDPQWRDALIALIGVITGSVTTIVTFWFARSRPQGTGQA